VEVFGGLKAVGLKPIRISKVTSNDTVPLIYIPKEARALLGLEKGTKVVIYVEEQHGRLVIEPL